MSERDVFGVVWKNEMSEYDADIADFEELLDEAKQWKISANMWKTAAHTWEGKAKEWKDRYEDQQDMSDYLSSKADEWRLRANHAKNLAQDLADVLRALRKRGLLHLDWRDESAGKWHDIPKSWREYITRG